MGVIVGEFLFVEKVILKGGEIIYEVGIIWMGSLKKDLVIN